MRALYEDSAVPIAEIARRAGVTERTIYKYVAKLGWPRRYRRAPDFAPAKGAGGRFIRRADKALPFAQGLKATDPAGARRAVAACVEAERLSRVAQAAAQDRQRAEARLRAHETLNRALAELAAYRAARSKQGAPPSPDDRVESALTRVVALALGRWERLLDGVEAVG